MYIICIVLLFMDGGSKGVIVYLVFCVPGVAMKANAPSVPSA